MPAYNFQAQFAPLIECGWKRQTVRKIRKVKGANAVPGGPLSLYTGQRTKDCRLLMVTKCDLVYAISLAKAYISTTLHGEDTRVFEYHEAEVFALREGFHGGASEMFEWFEKAHGLPFEGILIKW